MFFNSFDFAVFLPIVFILYWFVTKKNLKVQNILLLVASYFFYGWWSYKFLFLLMFSTFLDFYTGIKIHEATSRNHKKFWFWLSIIVNLGFLAFFKYYNFFIDSFTAAVSLFGLQINVWTLKILLPVGISFYTFHGMSYVIDIYKDRIKPVRSFVDYAVFVSFFPLLVAGPIERATHLLPQIQKKRTFNYVLATDGLRQIFWGLFKKIVIADNCAQYANLIFHDPTQYNAATLVCGAVFFAFQIYGDFSGYSDIALGTARLFGFELLRNFAYPYFSRDIAEFWRRWHISLSSWFKDYIYIPLGGSKVSLLKRIRNTFIIFIVSGVWHGANWTFVVWGGLNALYFLPLLLSDRNRSNLEIAAQGKLLPSLKEVFNIAVTFALTTFAWIFFRAASLKDAAIYIKGILSTSILSKPQAFPKLTFAFVVVMLIAEWIQREKTHALKFDEQQPAAFRWMVYYAVIISIVVFGYYGANEFIYFQF
ncbi:MBOAT family protein [Mucilaginibacter sp. JRF]|uniref:MBOAT family O-acyltransferase n=1 Tax=Mucilaginibacter sp. JRF TaxID=2780088 RepID=UPI0018826D83|nr:MBOAT family protein [Mucilaginibacter sp. JRF]MBE9583138.1 MBOAT family protein [Mucilaginibacter sp. JRF]